MFQTTLLAALAIAYASAHMRMLYPTPRGHVNNDKYQPVDYDLVAPQGPDKPFPCGGKTNKGGAVATFKAGETVNVVIEGSAPHGGGHCQMALACNGGSSNFVVIKSILDTCPIERTYPVTIPSGAKGSCVFAWTWFNALGNREMYMNCADVEITGGDGTLSGPPMTVLNLPGYDTMPERGASPFDASGNPNFRYGQHSTENYAAPVAPPAPIASTQPTTGESTTAPEKTGA